MALELIAKDDFTLTLTDGTRRPVAKHERLTEPKLVRLALHTHPDFIVRGEAPSVELDEPPGTVVPKAPTRRTPHPEQA